MHRGWFGPERAAKGLWWKPGWKWNLGWDFHSSNVKSKACWHMRACVCAWMDGPQKPVLKGQLEDGSGEPQRAVPVARVRPHQTPAPLPSKSSLETGSDTRTSAFGKRRLPRACDTSCFF